VPSLVQRLRDGNPLPEGSIPVGIGLVVSGIGTLAFLSIASHNLSPDDYSALGVLWALLFAVGNGLMQPLEQEVARAVSDRRARGIGAAPVVRRAATLGLAFTLAGTVVALGLSEWITDTLFDGDTDLFLLFLVGMLGFCLAHLVRGTLSSHGRFVAYGTLFGVEGAFRPLLATVLGLAAVTAVGAYGLVAVLGPYAGVAVAARGQRRLLEPGPEAPWTELSTNLGWLLLGIGSFAFVLNSGTVAVEILSGPGDQDAAGVFLNGLNIGRLPLFLLQAVLAALLPKLSHQIGRGAYDDFASALQRLLLALAAFGALAVVGAALLGPFLIDLLFGSDQSLGAADLALIATFASVFMIAGALSQALIAMNDHARMALGALLGAVVLVAVIAVGDDLYLRVEAGLVASAVVSAVWMGVCVRLGLRQHHAPHEIDLAEELAELPFQP
jgi:O-antigen/teichoic acid export membrane protein